MRLLPVTGFNIVAEILPESPLCQLKKIQTWFKRLLHCLVRKRRHPSLFLFFSYNIYIFALPPSSYQHFDECNKNLVSETNALWIKTYFTYYIKINVSVLCFKTTLTVSFKCQVLQCLALISMWGLCSLIFSCCIALVMVEAYCVFCVIGLWSKHTGSPNSVVTQCCCPGGEEPVVTGPSTSRPLIPTGTIRCLVLAH